MAISGPRNLTSEAMVAQRDLLLAIFEGIDEPIHVCDPETREVLFANGAIRKTWGDITGRKCYEVFHGRTAPCDACQAHSLPGGDSRQTRSREVENKKTGQWFLVVNKAIPWSEQRMVRCEWAIDITSRKRAERALEQSEQRLRKIADSSFDTIFAMDANGVFTYVSPAVHNLLEIAPDDAVGKHFSDFLAAEDLADGIDAFGKLTSGHAVAGRQYELLKSSGARTVAELNLSPIFDGGKVVGIQGIARDITDRKLADERLAQFRAIVDSSQDAIVGLDLEGIVTSWNPAANRLYGYGAEEVVGKSALSFMPPDRIDETRQILERVRVGAGVSNLETVRLRKDGSRVDVAITYSPIKDSRGTVIGASAIVHDITERKQAEHALREREERLSTIIQNASEMIFTTTPQGMFTFVSPAVTRQLGYEVSEIEGQSFASIIHPDDVPACRIALVNVFATGQPLPRIEYRVRHKNGTWRWITSTGALARDARGKPVSYIGIADDITDRRLAEEQLAEAKDLAEAANRAKSEFLANMSHEIRTPMTAILGFADVLLASDRTAEERDAVETIKRNGEHLLSLINGILDLSKIEAGRFDVHREACSPIRIAAEVASLMRAPASAKNLTLEVRCPGPLPESIRTDPVRLRQILINLLGNAVKYTEVGEVRLTVALSEGRLRLEVADTGIGIPPNQIGSLFEPFRQGDASTSRRFGGTGLGLAISKRLAQMLGGDIEVKSMPGIGSQFTLVLDPGPLDNVPMLEHPDVRFGELRPAATGRLAPEMPSGCRILLAEDGPDNQRLISFLLKKAGVEVVTADNGALAVQQVTSEYGAGGRGFDLVLMDMQMPVLDGYQATRQLRAIGYRRPIIAVTAHAMKDDRLKCLDAGCDDYLSKPIDRQRLLETVCRHLFRPGIQTPVGLLK